MTVDPLIKIFLQATWNASGWKCFGEEGAEAVDIVFRKNLGKIRPRLTDTGNAATPSRLNAGNETSAAERLENGSVLRILMVEDSDDDCDLICYQLKKCGYTPRVERVVCEKAMRTALEREQWDIIFTDHGLPGFSGLEAIALVRKLGLQIPILCITGSIDPVIIRQILTAGVRACISKDDLSLLCMTVKRALNGRANCELEKQ